MAEEVFEEIDAETGYVLVEIEPVPDWTEEFACDGCRCPVIRGDRRWSVWSPEDHEPWCLTCSLECSRRWLKDRKARGELEEPEGEEGEG